ncbi:MAG: 5'(3')-deoxyribonucleotidase [Daejeonella sp.]
MNQKKLRLAVDMDEVLADPLSKFISLYNRDYNVPLDLKISPGNEMYHHVPEHARDKWNDYINEEGFFKDLPVIENSQQVMLALQEKYDVYIVSAALEFRNSLRDKYDWLEEHFPFISWTNIIFCGDKIVNTDILIDDRIKNFHLFNGRKLLFTSPHNMLITQYERVNNWNEVADKLL